MEQERITICGVNWLGDSIMSMPALQLFRRRNPDVAICLLVKPGLIPLWELHAGVDQIVVCGKGLMGTLHTAGALRRAGCRTAFVFPNSLRSALIPFLGGIPERIGATGHWRSWLLSRRVTVPGDADESHQAREYYSILGLDAEGEVEAPQLKIPVLLMDTVRARFSLRAAGSYVAMMPGAARGPSKRWSAERFAEVGRSLVAQGVSVLVLGAGAEAEICEQVAQGVGCVSLAGKTSLKELAAVLSLCPVVVTNDSGGMHLAAAVGARVVAVYGITDPRKTGPLGAGHRILQAPGVRRARAVARESEEAVQALAAIRAETVAEAAGELVRALREAGRFEGRGCR
jgi:heptosyltransferase-2